MTPNPHEPGGNAADVERLRRLFHLFGATQCRGRSPVYEILSEGIASNRSLLDLLLAAPDDQRRPSLLFACVNRILASHTGAALASYCPIHGGRRPADAQLLPTFAAFCAEHRDALLRLLREKSTQTNEIRRCVALHLGLRHVQRHWPGTFALVEVGASAGLNLLFDRYQYRLSGEATGGAGAPDVVVTCDVRGAVGSTPILLAEQKVTSRLGIDQDPIDLSDAEARAWLEAFVWPEQVDDLVVLRAATNLALSTPGVSVVRGDAASDTARLLAGLPGNEPIVVFTASLLSYLSFAARTAFVAQLDQAAAGRRVAWVFAEAPGLNVEALSGRLARQNTNYAIGASLRHPDRHDDALLGFADPYLRWLAPARNDADDFRWVEG